MKRCCAQSQGQGQQDALSCCTSSFGSFGSFFYSAEQPQQEQQQVLNVLSVLNKKLIMGNEGENI